MSKFDKKIYMTVLMIGLLLSTSFGKDKLAQAGFDFLRVTSDARSAALGEAVNSIYGFSGSLFHNPATMGEMPTFMNASFSVNQWIADINHISASLLINPAQGNYGVFGFSLQAVDYGDIYGTRVAPELPDGYEETGMIDPGAIAIGLGYAKMLNNKFSVGGQIRWIQQSLGESIIPDRDDPKKYEANTLAYDFGTVYRLGIKSIAFGMSVRNFSSEVKYEEEDFQLPLTFTLGISGNIFDFFEIEGPQQGLLLSIDTSHPLAHPEQVKMGLEYSFKNAFFLRGGYIIGNSQDDFSFGFGFSGLGLTKYLGLEIDYSYTPFEWFDNVQRFTIRYSM